VGEEFGRPVDARQAIPALGERQRQTTAAARYVEYLAAARSAQRMDEQVGLARGVLGWQRPKSQVHGHTLEEVLPPVGWCIHGRSPFRRVQDADTQFPFLLLG
jgi:hypothetical protein